MDETKVSLEVCRTNDTCNACGAPSSVLAARVPIVHCLRDKLYPTLLFILTVVLCVPLFYL
jgi:hypothetical protein